MPMMAGIIGGAAIWALFSTLFFVFPDATSFTAAFFISPFACGYFGARLGGRIAALIVMVAGSLAALILSLIYLPDTSWEYPHDIWAGVGFFIAFFVLGNLVFLMFGSLMGIRVREGQNVKGGTTPRLNVEQGSGELLRGTATGGMPSPVTSKIAILESKEKDLKSDLEVIKTKKGLDGVPLELLEEMQGSLEKQLLDIILQKERLLRKSK